MWDGKVDPIWLTKAATDPAAGYAGCENNDIVGHVAYCAQLIIETPALWNTTVPDGNPHGYGVTYYQRATNYIAQMEVVQDNYMIQYFIDPSTHRITAPTSSAWTSLNENTTAWNRQMMFMNGFQRLSECHQLLGDNPAKVTLYDSVVAAAVNWFFTGLSSGSASGHPTYDWSYCPTCSGPEDNTLHSTYDIWGTTRAYESGRYGVSNATLVPFANTLRYVMNIATNEISTYVDGTGARATSFIRDLDAHLRVRPLHVAIMANMDETGNRARRSYDAMILWVKNARHLGGCRARRGRLQPWDAMDPDAGRGWRHQLPGARQPAGQFQRHSHAGRQRAPRRCDGQLQSVVRDRRFRHVHADAVRQRFRRDRHLRPGEWSGHPGNQRRRNAHRAGSPS